MRNLFEIFIATELLSMEQTPHEAIILEFIFLSVNDSLKTNKKETKQKQNKT